MCQYELWLYAKCLSSTPPLPAHPHPYAQTPHQTFFRVAKCPKSPHCQPPTPRPDFKSTSELPIQRRDRYCSTCFETLKSAMGGTGDSCWPCGEEHWIDRRLCNPLPPPPSSSSSSSASAFASASSSSSGDGRVVDLEGWNGMDASAEMEGRSRQARLKFLARNWKGWREWGGGGGGGFNL